MKYNKKNIMKNAWSIRRETGVSMSVALKSAWAIEKAMIAAKREGQERGWNYRVKTNRWVKGAHNRTYIDLRIYTNAWNCKRTIRFGYVDNLTGQHIAA